MPLPPPCSHWADDASARPIASAACDSVTQPRAHGRRYLQICLLLGFADMSRAQKRMTVTAQLEIGCCLFWKRAIVCPAICTRLQFSRTFSAQFAARCFTNALNFEHLLYSTSLHAQPLVRSRDCSILLSALVMTDFSCVGRALACWTVLQRGLRCPNCKSFWTSVPFLCKFCAWTVANDQ